MTVYYLIVNTKQSLAVQPQTWIFLCFCTMLTDGLSVHKLLLFLGFRLTVSAGNTSPSSVDKLYPASSGYLAFPLICALILVVNICGETSPSPAMAELVLPAAGSWHSSLDLCLYFSGQYLRTNVSIACGCLTKSLFQTVSASRPK